MPRGRPKGAKNKDKEQKVLEVVVPTPEVKEAERLKEESEKLKSDPDDFESYDGDDAV